MTGPSHDSRGRPRGDQSSAQRAADDGLDPRQPSGARALLTNAGLSPKRSRGQNFLVDPNTTRRIVELAGVRAGEHVIEVGPGLGALTHQLREAGARVTAIEIDPELARIVEASFEGDGQVRVVNEDARKVDIGVLTGGEPARVVANLPYNVATPLLVDILAQVEQVGSVFVMVQAEVADRLAALPGSSEVGGVSLKVAWYGTAEVVRRVPPTVFYPRPRVESALVRITRHPGPARLGRPDPLFSLIEAGYQQRRKTLRRSLASQCSADLLASVGIDPSRRAETVSLQEWETLAAAVTAFRVKGD